MFWDRQGNPIDVRTWGGMFEDFESRVVQRTTVGDDVVLTVWLGMDEYDNEPPLIFGSVIKVDQRVSHETRSATERDALVAHGNLVALLEAMKKIRDDKILKARMTKKMLEQREADWRARIGDEEYEKALLYWQARLTDDGEPPAQEVQQ